MHPALSEKMTLALLTRWSRKFPFKNYCTNIKVNAVNIAKMNTANGESFVKISTGDFVGSAVFTLGSSIIITDSVVELTIVGSVVGSFVGFPVSSLDFVGVLVEGEELGALSLQFGHTHCPSSVE